MKPRCNLVQIWARNVCATVSSTRVELDCLTIRCLQWCVVHIGTCPISKRCDSLRFHCRFHVLFVQFESNKYARDVNKTHTHTYKCLFSLRTTRRRLRAPMHCWKMSIINRPANRTHVPKYTNSTDKSRVCARDVVIGVGFSVGGMSSVLPNSTISSTKPCRRTRMQAKRSVCGFNMFNRAAQQLCTQSLLVFRVVRTLPPAGMAFRWLLLFLLFIACGYATKTRPSTTLAPILSVGGMMSLVNHRRTNHIVIVNAHIFTGWG